MHNPVDSLTRAKKLLAGRFGYTEFLPGQESSLKSILRKRNLLVVMPTGSGKSLLYQLPALMEEGLTVVVSPLISLMKDQVDELSAKGIPAAYINSTLGIREQRSRLERCLKGEIRLLYIAPERVRNPSFLKMLSNIKVSRMAVDEAHCISEWGHDFRPDYLRLNEFLVHLGSPLVTALTATATSRVQRDIIKYLGLAPDRVDIHVHGFDRPNLVLSVVDVFNGRDEKGSFLTEFLSRNKGPGIIYTGTRRSAEELGESLKSVEPRTAVYHAGMEADKRAAAQDRFIRGKDRVVVATSAFGMGIDKSDVRFVVHYNYPGSVEQYYQEIGRAGRDGKESLCVLLYSPADRYLREFFINLNYPGPELVSSVYDTLWKIGDNPVMMTYRQIADLCRENIKEGQVGSAVRLLDETGLTRAIPDKPRVVITLGKPGSEIIPKVRGHIQRRVLEALSSTDDLEKPGSHETTIGRLCNTAGLSEEQVRRALAAMHHDGAIDYKRPFRGRGIEKLVHSPPPFDKVLIDWKRQEQLRSAEEEKLSAMERYISNKGCRRASILNYFGEQDTADCGKCDNCGKTPEGDITGPAKEALYQEVALPVLVCVLHLPFPLGRNKIARIVTGSRSKNLVSLGLDINPAFGTVKAGQDYVKEVINNLILAGYLERKGEAGRPVLALSGTGRKAALAFKLDEITADGPQPAGTPGTKAPESTDKDIRHAVLKCVLSLPKPLGATKVAAILAGSKAEWIQSSDAAHLEVYGSLHATQKRIRETIHSMMEEKLFYQGGSSLYPVIEMAEAGLSALERLEGEPVAGGAREISRDRKVLSAQEQGSPDRPETESASCELDLKIRNFLTLETGKAKRILPELRKCRPRETARQLELNYDYTDDTRTRARAVWAAGELCGQYGSDFLIRCAGSSLYSIRSLAAEALGKVGSGACDKPEGIKDNMEKARQALAELRKDPDPQVRQIAGKALESFRLDAREKTS